MDKSELIAILYSMDEEEVYIEIDDIQYEIEIGQRDEVFDGFDTVYHASISLKPKEEEL